MINILEIDPVLTVFPYALLYYGLLLVSSILALEVISRSGNANKHALQVAIMIIFICQVVLLTADLIAYQGFQLVKALFPLAHRLLNLVCLVWLIWALFQNNDQSISGWVPVALSVVLSLVGVLFSLWWLEGSTTQDFNRSWMDNVLVGISLVLILLSGIANYINNRSKIVEAWLILAIAAAGFILYLLLPSAGNLPAAVMVSQLVYYPLLISLASRENEVNITSPQSAPEQDAQLRANVANAFLEVSLQPAEDDLEKALTHSLSLYLMADLFGLIHYEPGNSQAQLKNTYDLIREDHLKKIILDTRQMPILFEKLVNGEVVISNHKSELATEKRYLMQSSGYNRIGNLLLYPLEAKPDQPRWAFLGLSPYTNKEWGLEDLERLDRLQGNLGKVLAKAGSLEQDARQIGELQTELLQKETEINQLNSNRSENQAELVLLENELKQTQASWTGEVNLWVERQKELETELDILKQTIKENQQSIAEVDFLRSQKIQLEETIARNAEQTAQLKNAIDQASLLLKGLTNQDEETDQAEESKG